MSFYFPKTRELLSLMRAACDNIRTAGPTTDRIMEVFGFFPQREFYSYADGEKNAHLAVPTIAHLFGLKANNQAEILVQYKELVDEYLGIIGWLNYELDKLTNEPKGNVSDFYRAKKVSDTVVQPWEMVLNARTLAEAKQLKKELSRKYHPDLGGCTATMAKINDAFDTVSARLS